jgi:hypothetical protein
MSVNIRRRDFLKYPVLAAGSAAVASSWASAAHAQIKAEPGADKLTAYQDGPQVWVRWANALVTSYRAHATQKYPYLYPLAGPKSGLSLTTETSVPFPHHRSMLFACDHVNGGNYWQDPVPAGQIVSVGLKLGRHAPESAEILDRCEWRKPGSPTVMTDQRKITVRVVGPALRLIDAEIEWTAVQDVTVQKTNHSLFSIRAAADITPWAGGTLVNSEGQSGEKATFGKPAAWCCYFGKRAGPADVVEGIALLDHPKNPFAPTPWFTRDYGFISPTPFNFIDKPWQLAAGNSVRLRYRVVLFAGAPKEIGLEKIYRDWAAEA